MRFQANLMSLMLFFFLPMALLSTLGLTAGVTTSLTPSPSPTLIPPPRQCADQCTNVYKMAFKCGLRHAPHPHTEMTNPYCLCDKTSFMEEGAPCFSCLFQYDLDSDYRGNLFSAYGQCAKYLGGTCFVSCEGLDELVAKGCSKETGAWNVDIRSIPDDEEGFEDDYDIPILTSTPSSLILSTRPTSMFDTLTRLSATERIPTLTMTIPTPAMKPPKSHRMDEKLAVGLKVPKQLNPSGGKLNARAPNPFPQRNKDTPNYSCFCNLPVKRRIQACVRCRLGFESDKARNLEKYILGCDAPQTTAGTSTSTSPLTESKSGTSSGSGGTTTSGSKVTTTTGMKTSTQTPDATGGAVGKMEDGGLRMKLLLLWAAVYPLPWMLRHIGILPIRLARGGSGGGGVRS